MIRRPHGAALPRPARSRFPLSSPPFSSLLRPPSSCRDPRPADRRPTTSTPPSPRQGALGPRKGRPALVLAAAAARDDGGGGTGAGGGGAPPLRRTSGGCGGGGDDDQAPRKKHSLVPGTAAAVAFAAFAGWAAWDTLPTSGVDESAVRARVSIVIPCLNESAAIEQTLALACGGAGGGGGGGGPPPPPPLPRASSCPSSSPPLWPLPLEVIVVDGGSTDGTAELAEAWARRHNRKAERRRRRQQEEEEEQEQARRQQRPGRRRDEQAGGQGDGDGDGAGAAAAAAPPTDRDPPPEAPTVRVIRLGRRGRAVQMNAGAAAARGELLAFLHADTAPPPDLVAAARGWFRDRRNVALGFVPSIQVDDAWLEARRRRKGQDGRSGGGGVGPAGQTTANNAASAAADAKKSGNRTHVLLAQSAHNTVKTLLYPALLRPAAFLRGLRLLFGDQVLVVRAADLRAAGGFDERYAIMEDADLCLRLHKQGPFFAESPGAASSSSSSSVGSGALVVGGGGGSRAKEEREAAADLGRWALQPSEAAFEPGPWARPRGRVRMDCRRLARTSGRRLASWGFLRGSVTNFRIASAWYFSHSPRRVRELYAQLYTDAYR